MIGFPFQLERLAAGLGLDKKTCEKDIAENCGRIKNLSYEYIHVGFFGVAGDCCDFGGDVAIVWRKEAA